MTEELQNQEKTQEKNKKKIFPGGPTKEQLENWKAEYNDKIFMSEFGDKAFIWRPLTRFEYKSILKLQNADALFREERICETCILWPQNYNYDDMAEGEAGIPSLMAEQIMDASGFSSSGAAKKL